MNRDEGGYRLSHMWVSLVAMAMAYHLAQGFMQDTIIVTRFGGHMDVNC